MLAAEEVDARALVVRVEVGGVLLERRAEAHQRLVVLPRCNSQSVNE